MNYLLSVIQPLPAICAPAHYTETQLIVTVDQGIDWVRAHADEIAQSASGQLVQKGVPYVALNLAQA